MVNHECLIFFSNIGIMMKTNILEILKIYNQKKFFDFEM